MNAAAIVSCCALLAACHHAPRTLRLGISTEEPGPEIAAAIAASLREADLPTELVQLGTPAEVGAAVAAGTIDIALLEEPQERSPGVGALLPIYPSVLHLLAPRGSHHASLAQILTSRVYGGPPGSAGQRLARQLGADFSLQDIELLDNPWDQAPEVYFTFGGLLPPDSLRQMDGFALLGLGGDTEAGSATSTAAAIALRHPHLRPFVLPAGLYPQLAATPTTTLAVDTLLVARLDLNDDVAYRIVEQVSGSAAVITGLYPLARTVLSGEGPMRERTLPLHPGARRYLERNRPTLVERYVDVVALGTTLVITAVSGFVGWLRHRRRARKDRVDRYLTRLLALRRDAAAHGRLARLAELESEVLELVVAEKIEADVALIAFLQTCTTVRGELRGTADVPWPARRTLSAPVGDL